MDAYWWVAPLGVPVLIFSFAMAWIFGYMKGADDVLDSIAKDNDRIERKSR